MTAQKSLTLLWFGSFVVALTIAESYFWATTPVAGRLVPYLTAASRPPILGEVLAIYGPPIASILAFWFIKPFANAPAGGPAAFRVGLAALSTGLFNVVVLYTLAGYYLDPDGLLVDRFKDGRQLALMFDVLVVPINAFYFGAKGNPAGDGT